jgi:fructokinase
MFNLGFTKFQESVKELMRVFNIDYTAVTMGEDGAVLYSKSESVSNKNNTTDIIDTVGAGDAYSAILAIGILYKHNIERINQLANQFASEICNVKGALPQNEDVYAIYRKQLINE